MAIRTKGRKYLADFMVKGERHRKQFESKIEAEEYEVGIRARLHRGERVDAAVICKEQLTVSDLFDKVILNVWKDTPNEPTATHHCNLFKRFFGENTLASEVDINYLDKFVLHCRERGNAPATIKLKLATFSRAYSFALSRKWIEEKPAIPEVKLGDNKRNAFFSEQDESDILDCLEHLGEDYFSDFFKWQIDTGMRPSEARAIYCGQVQSDPILGYVVNLLETKNSKHRTVPLTKRAYEAFLKHKDKGRVWGYWTKERVRAVWNKVRAYLGRKGDKDFIFYVCRHTCGSRLVQRTGNIKLAQEWLGHKNIEQTMRYAYLDGSSYLGGLEALQQQHDK